MSLHLKCKFAENFFVVKTADNLSNRLKFDIIKSSNDGKRVYGQWWTFLGVTWTRKLSSDDGTAFSFGNDSSFAIFGSLHFSGSGCASGTSRCVTTGARLSFSSGSYIKSPLKHRHKTNVHHNARVISVSESVPCHISSRVGFNVPPNTLQVILGTIFTGQTTQPTVSKHWRTIVGQSIR